jgi:hypothetical protein
MDEIYRTRVIDEIKVNLYVTVSKRCLFTSTNFFLDVLYSMRGGLSKKKSDCHLGFAQLSTLSVTK